MCVWFSILMLLLCFFEPNLTASLTRDEAICINNYKCLRRNQIEDPNKLDKICRNFDSPFCYCCGGTKNYVEHGKICRRFCAIEIIKGKATKPCIVNERYNSEVNEAPVSGREPYPPKITLVPMSELICRGQSGPESSTSNPQSTTYITESTTIHTESTTLRRNYDHEEELITPINDQFRYGIDLPLESDEYEEPISDQLALGGYGVDLRPFQ